MTEWSLPDPATRVSTLPPPSPPTVSRIQSLAGWLLVTGGGLAMLGSVLPWSVVTTSGAVASQIGLRGDGRMTVLVSAMLIAVGVLALVGRGSRVWSVAALAGAVVITVVAGYNAFDLEELGTASDLTASLQVGHGLLMTFIGGVVATVGGVRLTARA